MGDINVQHTDRTRALSEDMLQIQIYFAQETLKMNDWINKAEEIVSKILISDKNYAKHCNTLKADKRYPKLKRDKEALRKTFPDKLKFEAALEELSHQSDMLKILQEIFKTSAKELEEYLTGDFSGLETIYRFLSNNLHRESIVRKAIEKAITNQTKKQFYLELVHYRNDWKAYFGFCLQYSSKINWVQWIKSNSNEGQMIAAIAAFDEKDENGKEIQNKAVPPKLPHVEEMCKKIKNKWDAISDEGYLPELCGAKNLIRSTVMSLIPPETPTKDVVHAYFKVIEECSDGSVKLLNHYWSTEKYFAANNNVINPSLKSYDFAFAVICPNPYGVHHFVLYVIEPKLKRAYFYDPLGINEEVVRDERAINQAIGYIKSHARAAGEEDIENWNDARRYGPKTTCIGLSGIFIAQFAKEISNGLSSHSFVENVHQTIDLMHAELLEGYLLFP